MTYPRPLVHWHTPAKANLPITTASESLSDISDLGLHLLEVVAECRSRGIDPEVALRNVTNAQRLATEQHF
jgi:hypothetical protein